MALFAFFFFFFFFYQFIYNFRVTLCKCDIQEMGITNRKLFDFTSFVFTSFVRS